MESTVMKSGVLENAIKVCLEYGKNTGHEYAVVVDGKGEVREEVKGNDHNVQLDHNILKDCQYGALVHNHPSVCSFSEDDLACTAVSGVKECWVVCQDGSRFKSSGFNVKLPPEYVLQLAESIHIGVVRLLSSFLDEFTAEESLAIESHCCNLVFCGKALVESYEFVFGEEMQAAWGKFENIANEHENGKRFLKMFSSKEQ